MKTTYTTVIVTRNRADALALSLPLHLAQSRRPEAIWVIDSSDDPSENQALTARLGGQTSVPVHHVVSPPGMTLQRNIGLKEVRSDVVFFPDDDSLVYPGALEAMMQIYDRDEARCIGGVCAREALTPPPGVLPAQPRYKMTFADRMRARISVQRFALEAWLVPNPRILAAQLLYQRLPPAPSWLAEEDAVTVEWMTGFRMSFRTESIRKSGFSEALRLYGVFEDVDASYQVLQEQILVGAHRADIYHHKAPERRANGRSLGARQVLNSAYVLARANVMEGAAGARIARAYRRYTLYKCAQYLVGISSAFGRARLAGAWEARRAAKALLHCPPETRDSLYATLSAKLLA